MEARNQQRLAPLDTLTHARLRAEQGDAAGARRILDGILRACPGHREARSLRESVVRERRRTAPSESTEAVEDPRVERLREWLRRVSNAGNESREERTGDDGAIRR